MLGLVVVFLLLFSGLGEHHFGSAYRYYLDHKYIVYTLLDEVGDGLRHGCAREGLLPKPCRWSTSGGRMAVHRRGGTGGNQDHQEELQWMHDSGRSLGLNW